MKRISKKIERILKYLLIGREFQVIDKFLFKISNGNYSGWVLGNQLRAKNFGKSKHISKEPFIFIGGFPRSGTTLLRAMLEQHSEIEGTGMEIFPFEELHDEWRLKEGFSLSDKDIENLEKYKKDVVLYTEKVAKVLKKKRKANYILFKHPKYMMFAKKTFHNFPEARFIHLIRDGRDATMSQKYWLLPPGKKEWPYEWCCRQYVTYIKRGRRIRGKAKYIEIKYEDLVQKPVEIMNKITNFLNLKKIPKPKLVRYYKNKNANKHGDHPEVEKPLKKKNINKWVNKMSERDERVFNKICGKIYGDLGYRK